MKLPTRDQLRRLMEALRVALDTAREVWKASKLPPVGDHIPHGPGPLMGEPHVPGPAPEGAPSLVCVHCGEPGSLHAGKAMYCPKGSKTFLPAL